MWVNLAIQVFFPEAELKQVFVRCKVLPGLFDTEFYVLVSRSSSAYVAQRNVKLGKSPELGQEVDGQVLAYLINQERTRSLVELPGEPVVGGLRTWVPNEMVAAASA